jgi:hypothetical protein
MRKILFNDNLQIGVIISAFVSVIVLIVYNCLTYGIHVPIY